MFGRALRLPGLLIAVLLLFVFLAISFQFATYAQSNPTATPTVPSSSNLGTVQPHSLEAIIEETGIRSWRDAGWTGQGQKIGVLDQQYRGISNFEVMSGLSVITPQERTALYDTDERTDGTNVLEIIHAIAPNAELYACRYAALDEFQFCVDWLIEEGVQIVVHPAGVPAWPLSGTNDWTQEVDRAGQAGVLWVNAAGNFGSGFTRNRFADTNGNQAHEFHAIGITDTLTIEEPIGDITGRVILSWEDREGVEGDEGLAANAIDLNLEIVDRSGNLLARSSNRQEGHADDVALESVFVQMGQPFGIRVLNTDGQAAGVEFVLFVEYANLPTDLAGSAIIAPGDSLFSLTVGALQGDIVAPYSSRGSLKPDLAAPGEIVLVDGRPFIGTAAAAPVVAGVAALVWEAHPDWDRAQVFAFLQNDATQNDADIPELVLSGSDVPIFASPTPTATLTLTPTMTLTPTSTPTAGRGTPTGQVISLTPTIFTLPPTSPPPTREGPPPTATLTLEPVITPQATNEVTFSGVIFNPEYQPVPVHRNHAVDSQVVDWRTNGTVVVISEDWGNWFFIGSGWVRSQYVLIGVNPGDLVPTQTAIAINTPDPTATAAMPPETPDADPRYGVVDEPSHLPIPVHLDHGSDTAIVGWRQHGSVVVITGEWEGWLFIGSGWVRSELVRIVPDPSHLAAVQQEVLGSAPVPTATHTATIPFTPTYTPPPTATFTPTTPPPPTETLPPSLTSLPTLTFTPSLTPTPTDTTIAMTPFNPAHHGMVMPDGGVNVREGPSTDTGVVGALPKCSRVIVYGVTSSEGDNWYNVGNGWIRGDLLQVSADSGIIDQAVANCLAAPTNTSVPIPTTPGGPTDTPAPLSISIFVPEDTGVFDPQTGCSATVRVTVSGAASVRGHFCVWNASYAEPGDCNYSTMDFPNGVSFHSVTFGGRESFRDHKVWIETDDYGRFGPSNTRQCRDPTATPTP